MSLREVGVDLESPAYVLFLLRPVPVLVAVGQPDEAQGKIRVAFYRLFKVWYRLRD